MGTRADFYLGRGRDAEWIGSIAWDGFPWEMPDDIREAETEEEYLQAVMEMLHDRDDATLPEQGWPWPWDYSTTTDYALAFDEGKTWASNGFVWWDATADAQPDFEEEKLLEFPNMAEHRQAIPIGTPRSGIIMMFVRR